MEKRKKWKDRSRSEIWILVKKVVGIILIVIGIFGLFLPLLQGFLLIILGMALFENKSIKEYVKNFMKRIKKNNK